MAISLTGSATLDPLRIGIIGSGDVSIGGGSTLTCTDAIVGQGLGGAGDLAISGAGSALLLSQKLYNSDEPMLAIGQSGGAGAVVISDGGILKVESKGKYSEAKVRISDGGMGNWR